MDFPPGENGLETHAERRGDRVRFPWQLQFLLDAVPGAEISREFPWDGDEEAGPGPDHGGTLGYQRLLHRSADSPANPGDNTEILPGS